MNTHTINKWNELYSRNGMKNREQVEIDSVPSLERWGQERPGSVFYKPYISKNARTILEIGCGHGTNLADILFENPNMTGFGFDLSSVAIAHGRENIKKHDLEKRMHLFQQNMHEKWDVLENRKFDIILARYCMQFSTKDLFIKLIEQVKMHINSNGKFIGLVRSVNRSVPSSYKLYNNEENTYISSEPHEEGMVYHHYTYEEIMEIGEILNAELLAIEEYKTIREHDLNGKNRAWWKFVYKVKG